MKKEVLYHYLGTNGTILSPVHLEDVYYVRMLKLTADSRKRLTKDGKVLYTTVTIPERELEEWSEIDI
jgi:hypothetical protein